MLFRCLCICHIDLKLGFSKKKINHIGPYICWKWHSNYSLAAQQCILHLYVRLQKTQFDARTISKHKVRPWLCVLISINRIRSAVKSLATPLELSYIYIILEYNSMIFLANLNIIIWFGYKLYTINFQSYFNDLSTFLTSHTHNHL